MKKQDEYLSTSVWYREAITDPYQTIAEFFSADDIASFRKHIKAMLKAACSDCSWRKSEPGDLLYYLKLIESVINAAFLINKDKKQSPLDITPKDIFNPNLYCGRHANNAEWDYFPRVLSFKEFSNPYLAFTHFFKYLPLAEWKSQLQEISEYALVNMSLFEAGIEMDILSLYFYLTKLVEAAHLIDVREINHIGGHIKNRAKIGSH
jgi:hypothetical protein